MTRPALTMIVAAAGLRIGSIAAALPGYRAAPDLMTIARRLVYWGGIAFALPRQTRGLAHA
ncbi:hypothetical protein U879_21090 [Defluviimonas sp. 20V17]|uniref:Biopterin-dependent aromatic amino acid hydroxylase family profile domain-containing protein n=1 Tax=Allgaiera indica TaxID=765699 RepID=A0AAN4UT35_9RHOB|nr:hypothetical protein [Allgaiera indica]KDB01700.1 hypothetical protein U879_21090 [Defluviimonas sp. 20V17]GHE03996.1 hypothetical protein GCM10008024_29420 [Allgaiera indica]SDX34465.1 hypothetical protein SAMN05444006_11438 [Allgaiera indica]